MTVPEFMQLRRGDLVRLANGIYTGGCRARDVGMVWSVEHRLRLQIEVIVFGLREPRVFYLENLENLSLEVTP